MEFQIVEYKPRRRHPKIGAFLYKKIDGRNEYCRVSSIGEDGTYYLELMPFGGFVTDWYTETGLERQNKSTVMYKYYKEEK